MAGAVTVENEETLAGRPVLNVGGERITGNAGVDTVVQFLPSIGLEVEHGPSHLPSPSISTKRSLGVQCSSHSNEFSTSLGAMNCLT